MKLSDFKAGPLDFYRRKATFDWKKLKVFFDGEERVKFEDELTEVLKTHPDFSVDENDAKNLDDLRLITYRQAMASKKMGYASIENIIQNPKLFSTYCRILIPKWIAAEVEATVLDRLFSMSILTMGTDKHMHFLEDIEQDKIKGCFCLTEIAHGSNVRGMKTMTTYNKQNKVFILNTPNFQAAKCWAGGLAKIATHAIVYAQLILEGTNHGLHAFVVPLRNPNTLIPYPGVTIGDMGEKIGLNGIDNGFVLFKNYEIPRENLLNKLADVTEDGRYVTTINDENKRLSVALGSLSHGRTNISIVCEALGTKAITIAIRYGGVRKQFGPNDDKEVPVLEYQSMQHRLLPHLAGMYVLRNFNNYFSVAFYEFIAESLTGGNKLNLAKAGMEIHAISSGCKALSGWMARDAIQESRECCGGHGYLKVAGIGDIRNDFDANLTYEGENHVLIQQTSNWLLRFWPKILERQEISSPLKSVDFLSNGLDILILKKYNGSKNIIQPESIIKAYEWLVIYLIKRTFEKIEEQIKTGKDQFWARNDSQVYFAKTLSIVYLQHFFLDRMLITIHQAPDARIRDVLTKLFTLYGLSSLEKHIPYFYQGGYTNEPELATSIHGGILKTCADLKDDAIALIDVIAPPDFIVDSPLGMSDGEVYKQLEDAMIRSSNGFGRPSWWKEIVNYDILRNKL